MTSILAHLKFDSDADFGLNSTNPPQGTAALAWLEELVGKMKSGTARGATFEIMRSTTNATHALGFIGLSSASGTVTVTANAATIGSITASGTDTEDATSLVAAIIADADNAGLCIPTNYVAKVTLASAASGDKIILLGETFTAATDFTVSGTDTQDAASFIAAVRAHPWLQDAVGLTQVAGAVHIGLRPGFTPKTQTLRSSDSTRLAVVNPTFAATTTVMLWATMPGTLAHKIDIGVTGTGMSVLDSATDFANGTGFTGVVASSNIFGIR
jgi:hypothetical protein